MPSPQPYRNAVRLAALSKSFGKPVVDHLDLSIREGEIYALLGPNGAGKTTTLRMLVGLLPPDAGEVSIFGIDALKEPLAAKAITAWLPDEPLIYDRLTPVEYLEFVAGLWRVPNDVARERSRQLLEWLDLWSERGARCEGFSKGMKQKVALAGALVHEPRLLVLDEPLTGLDTSIARQVKDLLIARARAGATIIITTHILEVAERIADRIGIIAKGKLLAEGTLKELRATLASNAAPISGADGETASLEDIFLRLVEPKSLASAA